MNSHAQSRLGHSMLSSWNTAFLTNLKDHETQYTAAKLGILLST